MALLQEKSSKLVGMIEPKFSLGLPKDAQMIRQKVFVEEQGYQHEFVGDDDPCWCLVLYFNGLPIATGRILEIDPETYRIGRVAVLKEYRGKKIGTYVLKFLEVKIKTLGGHHAILHAQVEKKGFYEKCGYQVAGSGEIDYDEGHPHVMMEKELKSKNRRKYPFKY
jgi:predicted GNAT family N-acyltransferase